MSTDAGGSPRRGTARYPFAGLAAAAVTGILIGQVAAVPLAWLAAAVGLLAAALVRPRSALVFAAVVTTFAAWHSWSVERTPGRVLVDLVDAGAGAWTMTGVVIDEPRGAGGRWRFTLRTETIRNSGRTAEFGAPVAVTWTGPQPAYGDRVRTIGTFRRPEGPRNPGEFDYAAWLRLQGVFLEFLAFVPPENEILEHGAGNSLKALALRSRAWISETLDMGLSDYPTAAGVIQAMTLGDTSGVPESLKEAFRATGTLHVFSVSGLHVGMLAFLLWHGLKLFRLNRPTLVVTVILLLFFYAAITGLRPASVRAAFMASLVLGGFLLNRPAQPLNSLCAAAFLILLFNTRQLFNPGFQLSFLVVTAILLFGTPFQRRLEQWGAPDAFLPVRLYGWREKLRVVVSRQLGGIAAISTAAWMGSLPLMAVYFHIVSWVAIPVNLIAVPLAFVILALALTSITVGWASLWLAETFNLANLAVTGLLVFTIESAACLPGAYVYFPSPMEILRGARWTNITVFDVGRGASVLIRSGGRTVLIDTGPAYLFHGVTRPALRFLGAGRLDALVLTHGDAAHVGAAEEMLGGRRPKVIATGSLRDRSPTLARFRRELQVRGEPKRILLPGDGMRLRGDVELAVLFPPPGLVRPYADDKALVLLLRVGEVRMLFMGDAGLATEDWLLQHARTALRADVVVKGEHVSGFSGSAEFLEATGARWIIRTWAGHPARERLRPEWAALAGACGAEVLSLGDTGAVTIRTDGSEYRLEGFLTGTHGAGKPDGDDEGETHSGNP